MHLTNDLCSVPANRYSSLELNLVVPEERVSRITLGRGQQQTIPEYIVSLRETNYRLDKVTGYNIRKQKPNQRFIGPDQPLPQ